MLVSFTPSQCARKCLLVFTRGGISIQSLLDSDPARLRRGMSYYQRIRPDCKIVSFYTTGTQKKINCSSVDGFCEHFNTEFEAMGCNYHYGPCQEARPSLTEENIQRGTKKREMDELRRHYSMEKGYTVMEMHECE